MSLEQELIGSIRFTGRYLKLVGDARPLWEKSVWISFIVSQLATKKLRPTIVPLRCLGWLAVKCIRSTSVSTRIPNQNPRNQGRSLGTCGYLQFCQASPLQNQGRPGCSQALVLAALFPARHSSQIAEPLRDSPYVDCAVWSYSI